MATCAPPSGRSSVLMGALGENLLLLAKDLKFGSGKAERGVCD